MNDIVKATVVFKRAIRGEELSWSDRMLLNHHFADKLLPEVCERFGSKRLHAFRMVIEQVLSGEPLVCFEKPLVVELVALMERAYDADGIARRLESFDASRRAAELMMAPST